MKSTEIEKQIANTNETLKSLQQVRTDCQARLHSTEEARRLHIVAALTGNKEAKAQLEKLNAEMDAAAADDSDAREAIHQVEEKLSSLNAELATTQREDMRESLRKKLKAFMAEKRGERIVKAWQQLQRELRECEDIGGALGRELGEFCGHERLGNVGGNVLLMFANEGLRTVPRDIYHRIENTLQEIAAAEQRNLDGLLGSLHRKPEPEPAPAAELQEA